MPWTTLTEPSLGLSILRSVLDDAAVPCRVHHLNLFMLRFVQALSYYGLANVFALNDFLFSGVVEPSVSRRQERWLYQKAQQLLYFGVIDRQQHGGLEGIVKALLKLRQETVPQWLSECADDLAKTPTSLVGFTCMFDQTIASVALAKLVKERAPHMMVALGGYAVRSPTGDTVLKAFPWIDAVCTGEGEPTIVPLAQASAGLLKLGDVPNLSYRDGGEIKLSRQVAPIDMNTSPIPNFDDFFADLKGLAERFAVTVEVERLPLENSRGCWWGAKHHCVFCGIHDDDLAFRARDSERVLSALEYLSERYGVDAFRFSDYILPYQYYKTLLPALAQRERKYRLSTEMKANISPERFRLMAEAGFTEAQPGIESFSSKVLKDMDKGVTGIQNVHTLLLGKHLGVKVHYNLLYGLPTDEELEYSRMLELLPRLGHLDPPSTRLFIQITRYAPLQRSPERFGIPASNHEPSYDLIFSETFLRDSGFDLDAFCYYFSRPFENPPALSRLYRRIERTVDAWKAAHRERDVYLYYEVVEGGLRILDGREQPAKSFGLNQTETNVLLRCHEPVSLKSLAAVLPEEAEKLSESVRQLDALGLIFREDDQIVSLTLPLLDQETLQPLPLTFIDGSSKPHSSGRNP